MKLPQIKKRQGKEFHLVNDFNCKTDAQKEMRKIRNENAFFGKKKSFVFSSQNAQIPFSFGVYEQVFYGTIV